MDLLPLDARIGLTRLRVADLHRDADWRHLLSEFRAPHPTAVARLVCRARTQAGSWMSAALPARAAARSVAVRAPQPCGC